MLVNTANTICTLYSTPMKYRFDD